MRDGFSLRHSECMDRSLLDVIEERRIAQTTMHAYTDYEFK